MVLNIAKAIQRLPNPPPPEYSREPHLGRGHDPFFGEPACLYVGAMLATNMNPSWGANMAVCWLHVDHQHEPMLRSQQKAYVGSMMAANMCSC